MGNNENPPLPQQYLKNVYWVGKAKISRTINDNPDALPTTLKWYSNNIMDIFSDTETYINVYTLSIDQIAPTRNESRLAGN